MIFSRLFIKIISKNRQVFFLQLFTLAIAFACTALITLFAFREFGYDTSFENSDRLFRALVKNTDPVYSGNRLSNKVTEAILTTIKQEKKDSAAFTKIKTLKDLTISSPTKKITQQTIHAVESAFFSIFSLTMLDSSTLQEPNEDRIFISKSFSEQLFGDTIPTDQTISIRNEMGVLSYRVAGIFKDLADNAHERWRIIILLKEKNIKTLGFDPLDFSVYGKSVIGPPTTNEFTIDSITSVVFQPLPDIYFGRRALGEEAVHGDRYSILILVVITLLILVLSVSNFINLTTVVLPYRAKEIAVKKLAGSSQRLLIVEFFKESFGTTLLSCLLGILILITTGDAIERTLDINVRNLLVDGPPAFYLIMATLIIVVSMAPVLITLRFISASPNRLLSTDQITFPRFKRIITFVQFALSVFLLMASIVVGRQINYSLLKEPGRNHEQIVYLRYPWTLTPEGLRNLQETWKVINPHIVDLMATSQLPHLVNSKQIGTDYYFMSVDPAFNSFFKLEVRQGRWFRPNDNDSACVINTIAAQTYKSRRNVIGIFKDINGQFNQPAKPLKLITSSAYPYNYVCIRILEVDIRQTISMLSNFFDIPESEIHFLDRSFARWMKYQDELNSFSSLLAVISMILSCTCVYGLGLSLLHEKFKQITLHKIFGASTTNITIILMKRFSVELVLAFVITVPLTILFLQEFLRTFVYATPLLWTDMVYPVMFCLTIVSGLCFYQAAILNRVNLSNVLKGLA